jgi:hypothetical protein
MSSLEQTTMVPKGSGSGLTQLPVNLRIMPLAFTPSYYKSRSLIEKEIEAALRGSSKKAASTQVLFAMDIHFIKPQEIAELTFGKPEGIRVVVLKESLFVVDFSFHGRKLELMHLMDLSHSSRFTQALKAINRKYIRESSSCYIQHLHFFFSHSQYMSLEKNGSKTFYKYHRKLLRISQEKLKSELQSFLYLRKENIALYKTVNL